MPTNACILTINGGSSSIKVALFDTNRALRRILAGRIERIGLPDAKMVVKTEDPAEKFSRPVAASDHAPATGALMDWTGLVSRPGAPPWPRWGAAWCTADRDTGSRSASRRQ